MIQDKMKYTPALPVCLYFYVYDAIGIYDESRIAYVGVRFHVCHLVIYLGCLLAGGGYSSVLAKSGKALEINELYNIPNKAISVYEDATDVARKRIIPHLGCP